MKTENGAMHNQINCWTSNSPIKLTPLNVNYNHPILNGHNQPINNQQIEQHNQIIINNNLSPRGSFSSDQATYISSSDYSFNSSTNSTNLSLSNNSLVTSTMNNVNSINSNNSMVNVITITNSLPNQNQVIHPQIKDEQQYLFNTIKTSDQLNQTRSQIVPRCFNDLPTPGKDKNRVTKKKGNNKQSNYKHVPHKDKPKHLVDKRNARERNRVRQVNDAFLVLRKKIPIENKNKRVSKVKTLKLAANYIRDLKILLNDCSNIPNVSLKLRNNFSSNEPTSTTTNDFKQEDEDTQNSGTIFDDEDFSDEASQQSNNQLIESLNQYTNSNQFTSTNSVESNQSSDTNNNIINSINSQFIDQNLSFNNSIVFNNDQNLINYTLANPNEDQLPIQNLAIKENLLLQNANCNTIYNTYANFSG